MTHDDSAARPRSVSPFARHQTSAVEATRRPEDANAATGSKGDPVRQPKRVIHILKQLRKNPPCLRNYRAALFFPKASSQQQPNNTRSVSKKTFMKHRTRTKALKFYKRPIYHTAKTSRPLKSFLRGKIKYSTNDFWLYQCIFITMCADFPLKAKRDSKSALTTVPPSL